MPEYYQKNIDEVIEELETDVENGLSKNEVKKRQEEHGPNELEEQETKEWYEILFENLNNIIVYLLGALQSFHFSWMIILKLLPFF